MDKQKDNYRYPREILVIVSVLYLCLSSINFAEAESITVYVKDQTGGNVHDHPNLLGKLRVDLSYEEKTIKTMNFTNQDHIIFSDLNHTGLYTVRAVATFKFMDESHCFIGGNHPAPCSVICPNASFQTSGDSCTWEHGDKNDACDDRGPYRCVIKDCTRFENSYDVRFDKRYKYVEMNEVLTHVDKNENDVAEVVLLTDLDKLGKYGEQYCNNVLNLSNIKKGLDPQPLYTLNDVKDSAYQEGMEDALNGAIDKAKLKDKKILNHIFDGSLKQSFITEAGSTLVILGVQGVTDPDAFEVNSRNWGYITAGVTASAAAEHFIAGYVLSGVAEGTLLYLAGPVAIGVVVAVPVSTGLDWMMHQEHEWHMCEHALEDVTDDINLYIYDSSNNCTPTYYSDSAHGQCILVDECSSYSITLINKGEPVSNVSVGVDSDPIGCSCVTANSNEKDTLSTNLIYSDNVLYSYQSQGEQACQYSSKFDEYGRLWMSLEVLPGVVTDFDTWGFSDAPMLKDFKTDEPYVANPSFPDVVYVGDSPEVTVVAVDDGGFDNVVVKWSYEDDAGTESMNLKSGSSTQGVWNASISIPDNGIGELKFFINASDDDENSVVNDNDQRMFEIKVVEDADSSGDAPDVGGSALSVSLGQGYLGFLVPQQGEGIYQEADWYKFPVKKGQHYFINLSSNVPLMVFVDAPGEEDDKEIPSRNEDFYYVFTASGTGYVYLGFENYNFIVPFLNTYPPLYGAEYTFNALNVSSKWIQESTNGIDYKSSTDVFLTINCGIETYCGVRGYGPLSNDPWTEIKEIDGYSQERVEYEIDVDEGEDMNGDPRNYTYCKVKVCAGDANFYVQKIVPRYNSSGSWWPPNQNDRIDVEGTIQQGECYDFTNARMHVWDNLEGVQFYVYSNPSYHIDTQRVNFDLEIDNPPTLNDFSVSIDFDSITLTADVSDDNDLDRIKFYIDDVKECEKSLSGTDDVETCVWDTTSEADDSEHDAYIKVYDKENNRAESEEITFTARNDELDPEIMDFRVSATEEGSVYGRNVSGKVLLSAIILDNESGVTDIEWSLSSQVIGTNTSFIWDTSGLNGVKNLRAEAEDASSNNIIKYFTVNVDNTASTIDATLPSDSHVLEGVVKLEVNASDSNTGVAEVEWFIELEGGEIKIGSGSWTVWGSGGLNGSHTLTVNVSDLVGNTVSENIDVTIISPDLIIEEEDVEIIGEDVSVTVHNPGSANASEVNVWVYGVNETLGSGVINSVTAGGSETLEINCGVMQGDATVIVDPYNHIFEINEDNNVVVIKNETQLCSGSNPPSTGDWIIGQQTECVDANIFLSWSSLLQFINNQTLTLKDTVVHLNQSKINLDGGTLVLDNSAIIFD